ncbi:hypothetical protein GCM10007216_06750 [Thalassobacillus devorans]|uniref:Membrane insertase YidC/Oxa/ALB C-terminal domain-containing protein n=1 Tax=Thalassobacillus devorans TaxID=279813 RepID=A0ABQ1NJR9_9BACI|nr:YidC/Oxa1 family membrane protein insertase [Thalassobacillus devorans]NIK27586.1 YidC/Oxa1 family membrane protein insertase [Thalassobacillus devorans]GGC78894.1 hypothetical protein GCM10007216_06750 [Thalassobacillus devorans]
MKRLFFLGSIVLVLLSGCAGNGQAGDGFLTHVFVDPFTFLIETTASIFAGSYGMAIILITLLIRLLLLPFMVKQYKNQRDMKEKMSVMQPEMEKLRQR